MNRTDRLLAIVLELQVHKQLRAEDLAAAFEVSKRTIYRDIQALSEAGVPIAAMPGYGYSLLDGFFLPPLHFDTEEALTLVMGSELVAQHFDAQYRAAAKTAGQKIKAVLSDRLRAEVDHLQDHIIFFATNTPNSIPMQEKLSQLRRATTEQRCVRLTYQKRFSNADDEIQSQRDVDPYALAYFVNDWYLMAYCHFRHSVRIFRLSRIGHLTILDRTFVRPAITRSDWTTSNENRKLIIRALFDREMTRWVRESHSYYMVAEEETPEGLLVTLKVRQEEEVFQWLFGWGASVRVLEPASLQQKLLAEAEKIVQNYRKTSKGY